VTEENHAAERLLKARETIAAEYKLDPSDWRVRQLALMECTLSQAEDKFSNERAVDVSSLLTLAKSIADLRETLKKTEPISVNIEFVPGKHVACPKCRHEFDPTSDEAVAPKPLRSGCCHCGKLNEISSVPFTESDPGTELTPQAPPGATPAANVVPLVTRREDASASQFHSAVLHTGEVPPLKREQPSHYRGEAVERERHPYLDAAGGERGSHPLPVPHGVI
jgi:hypothetical protein